ncbi:MAG: hypothetical protein KBG72_03905 [Agrobacterium sp.]|nr:hypothetical protein [Agrobacterium sp.]
MVKLLAFPGLKGSKQAKDESSASVAAQMPGVPTVGDGGLIFPAILPGQPAPGPGGASAGDWTNQELADLYRVESLLVQAGIRISTARGRTDEGDPWFVFCKEDGDVFVHLARIGGAYLLDSPGLGDVLHGDDFAELIGRFVAQVAARAAPGSDNVVMLRPRMLHDRTVRLHPAIMLAALVWSLYLASDDFASAAHAMEELSAGADHPEGIVMPGAAPGHSGEWLDAQDMADPATGFSSDLSSAPERAGPPAPAGVAKPAAGADRSAAAHAAAAMPVPGVAASLTFIAVSYGFLHLPEADGTQGGEAQHSGQQRDAAVHAGTQGEPGGLQAIIEGESAARLHAAGQKEIPHDIRIAQPDAFMPLLKTAVADEIHRIIDSALVEAQDKASFEDINIDIPVAIASADVSAASAGGVVPVIASASVQDTGITMSESQSLLKLVSQYLGVISDYRIGNMTVSATLDFSSLDKVLTHINAAVQLDGAFPASIAQTASMDVLAAAPQGGATAAAFFGPQYSYYDDRAKGFVSHFIQEANGIEMVQFNSEIVLVDMSALDEPTDIAYTRRWVTDDGHTISTIGHLQDFIDYGIA